MDKIVGHHLQYWHNGRRTYITTNYAYFSYNGVQYPAYCLDVNTDGVGDAGNYTVSIDSVINDERIWRVITSGYPYHNYSELGVETMEDAFVATKQAVYCILYDRDVRSFYNRWRL